jgi:DNA-binding XRE family transcriptional regulator
MRKPKALEWIEENGCHIIISHAPNNSGYCNFTRDNKTQLIHRYIYIKHYGDISENMVVMHKCDNRKCINIDHLQLGTPKENTKDMFTKQREGKQMRKQITFKNCIKELREQQGLNQTQLAKLVSISPNYLSMLENNKRGCTVEKAIEIASVLNVTVEQLFTKEERTDVRSHS